LGPGIEVAAGGRSHVEQQVAVLGDSVDEHPDQQVDRLVVLVVAEVAPASVQGLTGLPRHWAAVDLHRLGRLVLLRRDEVTRNAQPIVDQDVGLQLAREGEQLLRTPGICALATPDLPVIAVLVGEVVEEIVDLAVPGQELAHLAVQVDAVPARVTADVLRLGVGIVASRVVPVDEEVGMVPVEQGVVKADLQAGRSDSVNVLGDDVLAVWRVHHRVVSQLGVPKAEALVMLRGQHDVLHARPLGLPDPVDGIEQVRLEVARVALVRLCLNPLAVHQPLVAGPQCVQTPVHEETETIMAQPIELGIRHCKYSLRGDDHQHRSD
jgi:hypothetical protein